MDKALGLLAALAAGIGLYFVAENTYEGKRVLNNIHQSISNIHSNIIPVSTTPTQPDLSAGRCPKGMYLDQTDGIYRCHAAGETRELSPNVKSLNPQWQNAWASPSDISKDTGIPESIAKTVLPPSKKAVKKTEKAEKRHLTEVPVHTLLPDKTVSTQVQCPHDLSKMTCGSTCWKDSKLYKINCPTGETKETKKQKKSLVVPPNFPSQVTVTPGEEPYPEDQDVGGIQLPSDQTPTYPTIPSTSPTPITPPQPIITTPPNAVGAPFHPFTPWKGFASSAVGGCRQVGSHSGGKSFRSCRVVADDNYMRSKIGNNGYRIDAVIDLGEHTGEDNQEMSITSGGPGSNSGLCCGFTVRVNLNNGTMRMESEDWSQGGTTGAKYCEGASCVSGGLSSISGGRPVYGSPGKPTRVNLSWVVTRSGNSATYHGEATGPAGTVKTNPITNPHAHKSGGPPIIPFQQISGGKPASDSHRIRVDSAKTVNFNTPNVTVLKNTSFFGDLGYIDNEDLLI